jgi:hypothetical protein
MCFLLKLSQKSFRSNDWDLLEMLLGSREDPIFLLGYFYILNYLNFQNYILPC